MAKIAALHAKKDDGLTAKVRDLYRPLESSIQTMTRDHRSIVNHLNAASRQATPLQVDGRTMLVFCGLQTTKASIEEGKGFFDGSTLSAQFSRTIIEILATSESPGFGSCFGSVRPILCFNNLYQWVGNEIQSGNVSNDVFYQWLSLIKPLIIVTLGKEVAKVINKKSGYTPIEKYDQKIVLNKLLTKSEQPQKFSSAIEHQQVRGICVYVSLSGTLTICGEVHGIQKQARIKHKAIAVKTWLDKRMIDVKAKRIDVLDGHGDKLHTVSRNSCKSNDLCALWDFMLGLDHATVSSGIVVAQQAGSHDKESSREPDDINFERNLGQVKKSGKPPLRQNQLGSRTQNSPPQKIDALWLLNQFVNERFPAGGLFWTGTPTLFPESTADLQGFREFLRQPLHSDHSWSTEWLELLDEPNGLVTLSTSLKWLRSVQILRKNAASSTTSQGNVFRRQCSVYKLGPRKDGW
ncbi:unnamed protein product [Alternaria alternata]